MLSMGLRAQPVDLEGMNGLFEVGKLKGEEEEENREEGTRRVMSGSEERVRVAMKQTQSPSPDRNGPRDKSAQRLNPALL